MADALIISGALLWIAVIAIAAQFVGAGIALCLSRTWRAIQRRRP